MADKLDIIAYLHLAYGAMYLLGGLLFFGLFGLGGVAMLGVGAAAGDVGIAIGGGLTYGAMGVIFGGLFAFLAVPSMAAGYGILKRASWGRIAGFIGAALALTSVPVGTLLGVFTIIVLVDDEASAEFE